MPTEPNPPRWLQWAAIPVVALVVVVGIWVTGGLVTNDETIAKGLTAAWLVVAGLIALVRRLAVPRAGPSRAGHICRRSRSAGWISPLQLKRRQGRQRRRIGGGAGDANQ